MNLFPATDLRLLHHVWSLMVEQDKVKIVFSAGGVFDEVGWVRLMTGRNRYGLCAFKDDQLVLTSWLTDFGAVGTAYVHFCGFGATRAVLEGGKAAMSYYEKLPGLKVMMGLTPSWNRPAVKFSEAMGMTRLCTIPKILPRRYSLDRDDGILTTRLMEV